MSYQTNLAKIAIGALAGVAAWLLNDFVNGHLTLSAENGKISVKDTNNRLPFSVDIPLPDVSHTASKLKNVSDKTSIL